MRALRNLFATVAFALFMAALWAVAPALAASGSITRPLNTTTYSTLTSWNGSPTYIVLGVCPFVGAYVALREVDVWSSANPATKLQGVLWLLNAPPSTTLNDDASFVLPSVDYAKITGPQNGIAFTLANAQASGAFNSGITLSGNALNAPAVIHCGVADTNVYGLIEVVNAYVPASGETLTVNVQTPP